MVQTSTLKGLSTAMREIPFFKPSIGLEEETAVLNCMRSGWLTTGFYCQTFEDNIKDDIGDDVEVCCVSSATAGLHLALDALNVINQIARERNLAEAEQSVPISYFDDFYKDEF